MDCSTFPYVNMLTMHSQLKAPSYSSNSPFIMIAITIITVPFSHPGQAAQALRLMRQPYPGREMTAMPHASKQ